MYRSKDSAAVEYFLIMHGMWNVQVRIQKDLRKSLWQMLQRCLLRMLGMITIEPNHFLLVKISIQLRSLKVAIEFLSEKVYLPLSTPLGF